MAMRKWNISSKDESFQARALRKPMRLPWLRFTVWGLAILGWGSQAVVALIMIFVPHSERYAQSLIITWLASLGVLIFLGFFIILFPYWNRELPQQGKDFAKDAPGRFRTTMLRLMVVGMLGAVVCSFAMELWPYLWEILHIENTPNVPAYSEFARRMRRDAERWTRLAAEHPSHAEAYLRLAEQSNRAADNYEREAKTTRSPSSPSRQ
jgi:formate hydrogenlyase subunit 3/multisubunit Na+/H+ antiporter MnhD subunit